MKVNVGFLALQIAGMFLIFGLALFLPAGTIAWAAGWAFMIMFFSFTIAASIWLFKQNPDLLNERMTGLSKSDEKSWDKVLMTVIAIVFFAWLIFMPLDAVRFGWSQVPTWVQITGAVILLCSFCVFYLAYRTNPYLSPAVRIQKDRGQQVVSTGPYRYIRHPLYAGFTLFVPGVTLLLGSWYGLILGFVLVALTARRAVMEERALRDELKGYEEYMTKVKYRLIPFIW
ncbi:MAG: isoprenylcysteine carboxylmethyltransferase family protein [Chloroflexi bacterium]|nr:isoprenylcysteine carboxylmethyltransferase family protein [Chloroflexota bacterium]